MLTVRLAVFFFLIDLIDPRASAVKTNKMRFATNASSKSHLMPPVQLLGITAASNRQAILRPYVINRKRESDKYHEGRFLDEEDKRLLDEFYRETKDSDPFLSDSLSTEDLWSEDEKSRVRDSTSDPGDPSKERTANLDKVGWTFDERILDGHSGKPYEYNLGPSVEDTSKASYSPTLKLLTSYDPVQSSSSTGQESGGKEQEPDLIRTSNRIVGATLFGRDHHSRPNVSSKSAKEAVKLHNDMLERPPKDGKVRVRMYYHRAIHDDAKLYGTGPWKYWGHGWGLEFGYDPKKGHKDHYQRGYTIERAFGRDFCKDNKNCRKPDPNFFQDPQLVGRYSEQHFNSIKRKS